MLERRSPAIPFSTEALRASLLRLEDEFEAYQDSRDRDAVYGYLAAVFELVTWWRREGKAVQYAGRALYLRKRSLPVTAPEPFAAVILCTAANKVDYRMRSKWSRVLQYATEFKGLSEPLASFVKRKGGINKCAARFARCGINARNRYPL